ncbi:hypothetical protein [Nannocystis pusilla]|uniref:Lipoprotein n=1 Tax=Nannocystis pusilla TaxID=889268 RepID=A0ABS7U3Q1_9BACT|nr:hypothetical protein [Nannocystis pusilla]MBZ5715044.1 hypothetical protein [Nannocystis pusilla]
MQTFKMILGGAVVAGSLTGCVINTGGTDTNVTSLSTDTNASTETDATAGTDSTDGTATDATATEGTASATEGTDTEAPTTTEAAPTTTEEAPTSTSTTGTTTGGAMCGWSADDVYYSCGFEGEDPDGTYPITCPDGLAEGEPCSNTGLTGEGCCDANGDNWYCGVDEETMTQVVVLITCE